MLEIMPAYIVGLRMYHDCDFADALKGAESSLSQDDASATELQVDNGMARGAYKHSALRSY